MSTPEFSGFFTRGGRNRRSVGFEALSLQALLYTTLRATQGKREMRSLLLVVVVLGPEQCNHTELASAAASSSETDGAKDLSKVLKHPPVFSSLARMELGV